MNFILRDENALYYEIGYSCDNGFFYLWGVKSSSLQMVDMN